MNFRKTNCEKKVEEIKNRPCLLLYREDGSKLTIYHEQDLAALNKVHWQDPDKEEAEYFKLIPLTESELSIALLTGNKQELEADRNYLLPRSTRRRTKECRES